MRYKPRITLEVALRPCPAGHGKVVAMSKIVTFIVVALLLFFIVTQPETAADAVQTIGAAIVTFFEAILTFFDELV